jgi:hypothetical protein
MFAISKGEIKGEGIEISVNSDIDISVNMKKYLHSLSNIMGDI